MSLNERGKKFLQDIINKSESPAVQYMLVSSDSVIFEFNAGLADVKNHVRITDSHTLNAFSVTKTFTAVAILQLQEKALLNINDPISKYLDFYPYQKEMSIKQVLNHTGGLPNPMPLQWAHLVNEDNTFDYEKFVYNIIYENNELGHEPGEEYSYSNIGYLLLGEVIRKVSEESYKDYIEKNIINKLQLNNNEYLGFRLSDDQPHAFGYIKKWSFLNFVLNFIFDKSKYYDDSYDGWTQFKNFYVDGVAYGGLIGNSKGFSKYLQALLREDELITEKSKSELFGIQKTKGNKQINMTLSWFTGKLGNENYFMHAGGGGGYYCEIRIYPDKKLASVIMFNRTGVSKEDYLDKIDKLFINTDETISLAKSEK